MKQALLLGRRALRETLRTPESLAPTLLIPLFFLIVNVGQAGKIFPASSTGFLKGQSYAAFQLPSSLLLAASLALWGCALNLWARLHSRKPRRRSENRSPRWPKAE